MAIPPLKVTIHNPSAGFATYAKTGHQLDPDAITALNLIAAANLPPLGSGSVQEARANREARKPAVPPRDVKRVEDIECGGVKCRLYSDTEKGKAEGCIVFYHGGGWALGSIDTHDSFARNLALGSGCTVISVGYGLAPEHPFPQGLIDCLTATRSIALNASQLGIDPHKIAVCGDSAGGNFAAVVAQNPPCEIKLQVLIYPAVDARCDDEIHKSLRENKEGLVLETESMRWFYSHYFHPYKSSPTTHPLASPFLAPSSAFTLLPPAFIMTSGADPLYSEGRAYAEKLNSEGIQVEYHEWPGQLHAVATQQIGISKAAEEVCEAVCKAVRRAFGM